MYDMRECSYDEDHDDIDDAILSVVLCKDTTAAEISTAAPENDSQQ